jgi:hypothetical protein
LVFSFLSVLLQNPKGFPVFNNFGCFEEKGINDDPEQ